MNVPTPGLRSLVRNRSNTGVRLDGIRVPAGAELEVPAELAADLVAAHPGAFTRTDVVPLTPATVVEPESKVKRRKAEAADPS